MKDMDNVFTNKEELEYPLETDLVNIKVLNNNTRLLDEKKADISDIEVSLQGVAKERSEYSIEDRIKKLEENIKKIIPNNNEELLVSSVSNSNTINLDSENLIFQIDGAGEIFQCFQQVTFHSDNEKLEFEMRMEIDGVTILFFECKTTTNSSYRSRTGYVGMFSESNIVGVSSAFQNGFGGSSSNDNWRQYKIARVIGKHITSPQNFIKRDIVLAPNSMYNIAGFKQEKQTLSLGADRDYQTTIVGGVSPVTFEFKKSFKLYFKPKTEQSKKGNFECYYKLKGD